MAGTQKDIGACKAVPDKVKKEILQIVVGLEERLISKSSTNKSGDVGEKRKGSKEEENVDSSKGIFKKRGVS